MRCALKQLACVLCLVTIALVQSATAQTYEASSFQSQKVHPRAAFDGDEGSRWSAKYEDKTGWIQVTYDESRKFKSVTIFANTRELRGAPKTFEILSGAPVKLKVIKLED